ncbi:MAG: hypothetical protein ACHQNT_02290 [Bacteroidia bacterium]
MHIGNKITEVLALRHMTKQTLGRAIGFTGSAATYLTTRPSIDVETLQKIGNQLKYNFFKHYPVEEDGGSTSPTTGPLDDKISELKIKISELEKNLEACKRDLVMQKQENVYLKKINELLEKR